MRGWPVGLVVWLLVLAVAEAVGFVGVWRVFVQSEHGQLLDTMALAGNSIGQARIQDLVGTVLNAISVVSVLIATAVVGFIALIRRRIAVAFGAVLLIAGATVSTQVLKVVIHRPQLGVGPQRASAGNSLPSGHTAVAASVAVALVLVLPARVRGVGTIIGAMFAALAGTATLSAGWHRPSDAVAALLLVGAWAAVAGLVILLVRRRPGSVGDGPANRYGPVDYGPANRYAVVALAVVGLGLLAGAAVALDLTNQVLSTPPEDLGRRRLLAAYAGGALGIAGTASLVMALVLATAHRVVTRSGLAGGSSRPAAQPDPGGYS